MKIQFKASFQKRLRKIKGQKIKSEILDVITNVENAENLQQIRNLRKIKGYADFYRIRSGDYRIGLKIDGSEVIFVVIEHRSNIYRIFP
jgi:mRNA interferase RelE/StbE